VQSRELTNYTYELTPLNREHLAWFVAEVAGIPPLIAREYMSELEDDLEFAAHVEATTLAHERRGLADSTTQLHKRLGWYALVRARRPAHVVETGTDKGLGSIALAAALLRNGGGRLTTFDVNPDSGYLISGTYADVVTHVVGDSLKGLRELDGPIDFFLHDSLHTVEHEWGELEAVAPILAPDALILSDNAHVSDVLPRWAESTGRRFSYFQERPKDHWYPGAGIGVAR
jgi:predicted O-methyltransferase YrrM